MNPSGPRLGYIGGVYGTQNLGDNALRYAADNIFNNCTLLEFPRKNHLAKFTKFVLPIRNALFSGGTLISQDKRWLDLVAIYTPMLENFIVFGTGVAHPMFWDDKRKEWGEILKQFNFVGVRGPLSAQLLIEANIKGLEIEIVGDPVLTFAFDKLNTYCSNNSNIIGLNIGWDRVNQWGTSDYIFNEAVRLAMLAKKYRWNVRWFVVSPTDAEMTRKVASDSGTSSDIFYIYDNPQEYLNIVKYCNIFVGTRLHSVVLANCAYVPSLMIAYRPKCLDYMQSIEQDKYVITTDKFKAEEVWDMVINMNSIRNKFAENLYLSIKKIKDKQLLKAMELQNDML